MLAAHAEQWEGDFMMKAAWIGGFLALGVVACGDDSGGVGGGSGGSSSTGDAASTTTGGTPTSSSTAQGSTSSSNGSGGDPGTGGAPGTGGDPGTGGAPGTGGDDPGTGGAPGTGGGEPAFAAEIVDCDAVDVDVEVGTDGGSYTPSANIDLFVGEVLRFDPGGGAHDFDSDDGSWADTPLSEEVCLQFNVAGEYTAFCSIHLFEGAITVE
jgi:plastocyanin